MPSTPLVEADELTAAEVVHKRFSAMPGTVTIGEVRKWFAESSHRKLAILANDGHYVGSIARKDLDGDLDPASPAAELSRSGPTVAPHDSARTAYELATSTDALRLPVVDGAGTLIGVVGITEDRSAFCGTR